MSSREEHRRLLIDAATRMLSRENAQTITVEQIAHEAGLSCADAHAVFADLPDVYEAVMRELAAWSNVAYPNLP